jgi:hypothetical protein
VWDWNKTLQWKAGGRADKSPKVRDRLVKQRRGDNAKILSPLLPDTDGRI